MATCLFTGVELPADNAYEHVIPEALGGRIKSRTVDSAEFNNKASASDQSFVNMYTELLRCLSPLLPTSSQPGSAFGIGRDGMPVTVDEQGSPRLAKVLVTKRNADDRPAELYANSPTDVEPLLTQLGVSPEQVHFGPYSLIDDDGRVYFRKEYSRWCEIAALKSVLATLDVLLEIDGKPRFTRAELLQPVREFVRKAVMDGVTDLGGYRDHVMGLQFGKIPLLQKLRNEVISEPARDFEHLLIVSGNVACRCLDAVWLVAGVDAFGFRLSRAWSGYDFTYVNAIGMLKNDSDRFTKWLDRPEYVCAKTQDVLDPYFLNTKEEAEVHIDGILTRRGQRLNQQAGLACLRAEMLCDEYLLDTLPKAMEQLVRVDAKYSDPRQVLCKRLYGVFSLVATTPAQKAALEKYTSAVAQHLIPVAPPDWQYWLPVYREALENLTQDIGVPDVLTFRDRSAEMPKP